MSTIYVKFLRQILIFSGILGLIALGLFLALPDRYLSPALPFLFPLFIAASLLSFRWLAGTFGQRFIKFVNTFLLTIVIKLFFYIGIIVVYLLTHRDDAVPFTLGFFVLYLCYTLFESISIIRFTQHGTGSGEAGGPS